MSPTSQRQYLMQIDALKAELAEAKRARDCAYQGSEAQTQEQLAACQEELAEAKKQALMDYAMLAGDGVVQRDLQDQLAASCAREKELRGYMPNIANGCRIWGGEAERARKMIEEVLALPLDDSALKRYVAKELREILNSGLKDTNWRSELRRRAEELENG